MAASDLDIRRSAHLCVQLHGERAIAHARAMVETMRAKGDAEGADLWLRIVAAIVDLSAPIGTRH